VTHTQTLHCRYVNILTIFSPSLVILWRLVAVFGHEYTRPDPGPERWPVSAQSSVLTERSPDPKLASHRAPDRLVRWFTLGPVRIDGLGGVHGPHEHPLQLGILLFDCYIEILVVGFSRLLVLGAAPSRSGRPATAGLLRGVDGEPAWFWPQLHWAYPMLRP